MSKLKSIKTKISAVGVGATLLIGLSAGIYALSQSIKVSQNVIDRTATQMVNDVKTRVDGKKLIGEASVVAIASNSAIQQAMQNKDAQKIVAEVESLSKTYKQWTELKNIQTRFVDAEGKLIYSGIRNIRLLF